MGNSVHGGHEGVPPEPWAEPFWRALGLHGRPESRVKWYFVWARRFAASLSGKQLRLATCEDAEGFLATLSTSPGFAAWQVEQAADALKILLGSVFGQGGAGAIRVPVPAPPPDVPLPEGDDPVDRLRYAVRCRRYSARTEQAYAFWVNRFLTFCREGGIGAGTDTVRAFLERLVVAEGMSASTGSTPGTWSSATRGQHSGLPWSESTRPLQGNGRGNTSSPPRASASNPGPAGPGGTTCMRAPSRGPSGLPRAKRILRSRSGATPCGTASPLTCSSRAPTYARCRSCSGTATSRRR